MPETNQDKTLHRPGGYKPPPAEASPDPAEAERIAAAKDALGRAAKRAQELREHGVGDGDTAGDNKYYIDPAMIPAGWDYEWKTFTVLNMENPSYQVTIARGGWEPVPASRHPEFMPKGWSGHTIDREGLRLMERPAVITAEARAREARNARLQVNQKEEQIKGMPAGANSPFEPADKDSRGRAITKINKDHVAISVPRTMAVPQE
jgi:hypothetical protein